MSRQSMIAAVSWLIVAWLCYVFLGSIPYKFTGHPDTQYIFSTIGSWMSGIFGDTLGELFSRYGAYVVGSFELLTSVVLLLPALIWILGAIGLANSEGIRPMLHCIGGLMAFAVMTGAVFFHLFTPLGIEVLHQGKPDGGSLFYSAVSIVVLGLVLFFLNRRTQS